LSEAAVAGEQAREHALRNNELVVELYYQRKALYKAYYDSQAPKRHSDTYDSTHVSQNQTPPSAAALLPDGRINWPVVCQGEPSRAACQKLDCYFAHHCVGYKTGVGTKEYDDAHSAIEELTVALKSKISELSGDDYLATKKFLKGLDIEART